MGLDGGTTTTWGLDEAQQQHGTKIEVSMLSLLTGCYVEGVYGEGRGLGTQRAWNPRIRPGLKLPKKPSGSKNLK